VIIQHWKHLVHLIDKLVFQGLHLGSVLMNEKSPDQFPPPIDPQVGAQGTTMKCLASQAQFGNIISKPSQPVGSAGAHRRLKLSHFGD
jgi:hypothetical protein